MKIVADENIASLSELFESHGEVISLPGRKINADDVRDADVLLLRSVTKVDENLLANSRVKFVGSCTIGIDHMDVPWLEQQGIQWAYAPGCNANAVVDYVIACLFALDVKLSDTFTVGIVGCGNVGSRLQKRLTKMGIKTLCCDPFVHKKNYVSLEQCLSESDMVCLHTPLTKSGDYPTFHMINDKMLPLFKNGAILLNAGRGAVVENQALSNYMEAHPDFRVVLDVWEGEPTVPKALLNKVQIATPHIAGYSVEGKQGGSEIIYDRFCEFFNIDNKIAIEKEDPIILDARQFVSLRELLLACYNPLKDSEELKHAPQAFDQLRKLYVYRREFSEFKLRKVKVGDKKTLRAMGFIT